ncbi:MAG: hypothetical protein LDLANPLL_02523 [Turneriella sp.]|nr:hypothetical protein [Turneriella sp.]
MTRLYPPSLHLRGGGRGVGRIPQRNIPRQIITPFFHFFEKLFVNGGCAFLLFRVFQKLVKAAFENRLFREYRSNILPMFCVVFVCAIKYPRGGCLVFGVRFYRGIINRELFKIGEDRDG